MENWRYHNLPSVLPEKVALNSHSPSHSHALEFHAEPVPVICPDDKLSASTVYLTLIHLPTSVDENNELEAVTVHVEPCFPSVSDIVR